MTQNNGHKTAKKKLPTKKQAALVKALSNPKVKTVAEASKIAGYYDRQSAHNALQSPTVQDALKDLIEELRTCGIDHKLYAKKAKDGLDASTKGKPNYKERREMLSICLKLEGFLSQKDDKDSGTKNQLIIVLGGKGFGDIL